MVSESGVQTFTVTVASTGGSPTSSSVVSVTVNGTPQVSISPSSTTIGGGQSVTLTASGAESYSWDTGESGAVLSKILTQTKVFSVTGLNGQGCTGTALATVTVECGELIQARASSLIVTSSLGPNNCSVSLQGSGYGTGYTITGPGGYVFSAVYRKVGYYAVNAPNITKPGTYTMTVSYADACERITSETMTYVVTGEACR